MVARNIHAVIKYATRFDDDRWAATWPATGATAYGSTKMEAVTRLDTSVDRLLDRIGKTGHGDKFLKKYGAATFPDDSE